MRVEIRKSKISGRVKAPASKSWTHRALILAALTKPSKTTLTAFSKIIPTKSGQVKVALLGKAFGMGRRMPIAAKYDFNG